MPWENDEPSVVEKWRKVWGGGHLIQCGNFHVLPKRLNLGASFVFCSHNPLRGSVSDKQLTSLLIPVVRSPKPSAEKTGAVLGKISNRKRTVSCHKQPLMNSTVELRLPSRCISVIYPWFSKHFTEVL